MAVKCKKFVLQQHFQEWPKESDLQIVEEELPSIRDGGKFIRFYILRIKEKLVLEFLAEAVYLSIDPYMRAYVYRLEKGSTMIGSQVAR